MTTYKHIDTKLIHAGEPEPRIMGAVSMPIFQSAMFEYAGETGYHDLKYIRLNNTPSHTALHAKLAAMENGEAALAAASGMAAIMLLFMGLLKAGDHVVCSQSVFGSTIKLLQGEFGKFGVESTFVSQTDVQAWRDLHGSYVTALLSELRQKLGGDARKVGIGVARGGDRLEIAHPDFERQFRDVPIRQSAAALVVAHERVIARQRLDPMPPHRVGKIVLEMVHPVGGLDQRRAAAGGRRDGIPGG